MKGEGVGGGGKILPAVYTLITSVSVLKFGSSALYGVVMTHICMEACLHR